ncbi:MAG TPA: hypothetical protein VEW25_08675 [Allosphingosinicella sp.]|nr:hypothetical protein [Allosphingosinicella sp.]
MKIMRNSLIVGAFQMVTLATLASSPANAQPTRIIAVWNDCPHPIEFIIHHADRPGYWHPHAWYRLNANQSLGRFSDNGVVLTQLVDHTLYIYAQSTDGSRIFWQGTGPRITYDNAYYSTVAAPTFVNRLGETIARLTCTSR